jgi:sugar phosphate permease
MSTATEDGIPVARKTRRRPYYGWTIAWTFSLTETISWGILYYAFSVFLVPMQQEFGWSSAAITGAYSLAILVSGLVAPWVGRWLDDRGPRALMTAGSIAGTLLMLAWARVDTLPGFYLIWVGIGLAQSVTLYEPAFATLMRWFERDRGRAMLLVTIAAGFASTIFLPLSGWLIDLTDWRTALVILAVILGVLTIPPHALLLRRHPEDMGLRPDGETAPARAPTAPRHVISDDREVRHVLRESRFWWMTIAYWLHTFASIAVAVHLIAYLTERGDGATFAATMTGLIGAAQVFARIVTIALERRFSLTILTAGFFFQQAIAIAVLLVWEHPAGVLIAAVFLGMGRGAVTLIRPGMIAQLYGTTSFGSISGVQTLVITGARASAPVAAGTAYALADGYTAVFWVLAAISLVSAAAILPLGTAR